MLSSLEIICTVQKNYLTFYRICRTENAAISSSKENVYIHNTLFITLLLGSKTVSVLNLTIQSMIPSIKRVKCKETWQNLKSNMTICGQGMVNVVSKNMLDEL